MALFSLLRAALDALYRWAGYLAAVFLIMILGFVTLQMVSRWGERSSRERPISPGIAWLRPRFWRCLTR